MVLIWMVVIFMFSAKPADESSKESLFVGRMIGQIFMKDFGEWTKEEQEAFENAVREAQDQLIRLERRAAAQDRDIFMVQRVLLEDEGLRQEVASYIRVGAGAAASVERAAGIFAGRIRALEDPYMRERACDILDACRRAAKVLDGQPHETLRLTGPAILVAEELYPTDIVTLDRSLVLGFITSAGSPNAHAAIIARTMGIPAVCGLGEDFNEDFHGKQAYIVGETGQLILEPDEETLLSLKARHAKQEETRELMRSMVGQKDVTLDGKQVNVYCNIGSPEDVASVLANDGQGIGLFRSEFLYLASEDYPGEEEQLQYYLEIARQLGGQRFTIRTLDIGADKQVDYFHLHKEENPAMGLRAIRICLNRPEVFRTQLRALYRASAYGKIAIMFPMIASVWEVKECRRACQRVMDELTAEGIPFNPDTEIGIMIETPAAVFIADELAQLVDFFSVGTNDLTQYTLACDRQCNDLGKFFDPHHPALLRALKMTADAAHQAGIWIGICGELGADLSLLPTFLAMGIDELSVTPTAVLPLRAAIRKSIAKTCTLELLNS